MTITIELASDTEAALAAQASARGLSLEAFLNSIIESQATAMDLISPPDTEEPKPDATVDAVFNMIQIPPGVGQGSLRREDWYR